MINSILFLGAGLACGVSAACSRSWLQDVTADYLKAQAAGQPAGLPLAPGVSYAENDTPVDISKGVLAQPIKIDFSRSIYDTVQCATFTELTAATNAHPYVIHTRIFANGDGKISSIESFVSDDGDWAFNATGHLYWTTQESWTPIPEGERTSRAAIQAAADAYLDQWGNVSLPVPLGTPCQRLEGGTYTGERNRNTNTCAMGAFPEPLTVNKRRYIIDEESGAIDVFNNFPWLEITKLEGTPSSNFIRVEKGLIRYIHEVTICATVHCGRDAPPPDA